MRDVGIVTGNDVNIECQTHEDAEKAVAVAREVLLNIPQDRGFGWRTKRIADTLTADDNTVVFSEDCEALPVLDFIDMMKDVMKAIAKELKGSEFSFGFEASDSDIPEGYLDGSFDGKTLSLETMVCGDGLCCPYCGEFVVDRDEYKRGQLYTCPSCDESLDLDDTYDENEYCSIHAVETIEVE